MKRAGLVLAFLLFVTGVPFANASELSRGVAAFKHRKYEVAATLLAPVADRGDAQAQAILCYLYTYGRGVPQNYAEAATWCLRAAAQGNAEGQYMLGLLYNKGQGVPEDFIQAHKWLNLAASRAAGPKREFSYRIRDSVASKMSPAQLSTARRLAVEWRPVREDRH